MGRATSTRSPGRCRTVTFALRRHRAERAVEGADVDEWRRFEPFPCYPAVGTSVGPRVRCRRPFAADGTLGARRGWPARPRLGGPGHRPPSRSSLNVLGASIETARRPRDFAPWSTSSWRVRRPRSCATTPTSRRSPAGDLDLCFDGIPAVPRPAHGVLVVNGPGAALLEHDVLWYADLPKRYAEAATIAGDGPTSDSGTVTDDRRPSGSSTSTGRCSTGTETAWPPRWIAGSTRRTTRPPRPRCDGDGLRRTMTALSAQPVRTCADLQHHLVGRPLGAVRARHEPGRSQHRAGLRAHRPRERDPRRRARSPRRAPVPPARRAPPRGRF